MAAAAGAATAGAATTGAAAFFARLAAGAGAFFARLAAGAAAFVARFAPGAEAFRGTVAPSGFVLVTFPSRLPLTEDWNPFEWTSARTGSVEISALAGAAALSDAALTGPRPRKSFTLALCGMVMTRCCRHAAPPPCDGSTSPAAGASDSETAVASLRSAAD